MQFPKNLSIVIPVYNEENRLKKAFKIIVQFHLQQPNWEFILVNDGSSDGTEKIIKKFLFVKLISYSKNQGKGYALKQGVSLATQPLVLLSDIDFSSPLTELPKLATAIKKADLAIGSRKTLGAKIIKHQPWWREYLGRQFTNLSKLWLGLKVSDVTCGFKLFKTPKAKKLFGLSIIKRWSYDAEILFLAKKTGFTVAEVPVLWKNDIKTKVNLTQDIFKSLTDLWLVRWNKYEI